MSIDEAHHRPQVLMPVAGDRGAGSDATLTALIRDLEGEVVDAIEKAGCLVKTVSAESLDEPRELFGGCSALLIPGGGDVDPMLYGGRVHHPALYNLDVAADRLAISLARYALTAGMPILAICRGMHVLNVAMGGTLVQHVEDPDMLHRGPPEQPMVEHSVSISPGSQLARILGTPEVRVRSGHHQALDQLGEGLVVVALASDGVVEAVEGLDADVIGIQWHPEDSEANTADREAIFGWLRSRISHQRQDAPPVSAV